MHFQILGLFVSLVAAKDIGKGFDLSVCQSCVEQLTFIYGCIDTSKDDLASCLCKRKDEFSTCVTCLEEKEQIDQEQLDVADYCEGGKGDQFQEFLDMIMKQREEAAEKVATEESLKEKKEEQEAKKKTLDAKEKADKETADKEEKDKKNNDASGLIASIGSIVAFLAFSV